MRSCFGHHSATAVDDSISAFCRSDDGVGSPSEPKLLGCAAALASRIMQELATYP